MVTYLVSGFESTVVVALLLHSIIGQVDHAVGGIFEIVLAAARPQVAVSVPVRLQVSVGCRAQGEAANVELSVLVKKRLFDVLLNDVAAPMPIYLLSLNETLDVV